MWYPYICINCSLNELKLSLRYDDYEHVGYTLDGKKIRKPKRGDELDHFLRQMEDGNAGITVRDPLTGKYFLRLHIGSI